MTKNKNLTISYFTLLDSLGSNTNAVIGLMCCLALGLVDLLTPAEYAFSFLYLLPIAFTTWFSSRNAGLFIASLCTILVSRLYLDAGWVAAAWNIISMLGIFSVVALTFSKIRLLLEVEKTLSRVDSLTGALNLRAFTEFMEYEIKILQREFSPFSLAYIDVDNFKSVNDTHGHGVGDELLKSVVMCIKQYLRKTDVIARVGGDEFVVFFPSTDQNKAKVAIEKIYESIAQLSEKNKCPITVSMGVVTSMSLACKYEKLLSEADRFMYEVKKDGKNHAHYVVFK